MLKSANIYVIIMLKSAISREMPREAAAVFKRKAYRAFERWRMRSDKTVLCVTGARQVGKSTLVEHLGQQAFERFVEINLLEKPAAKRALTGSSSADDLISRISLFTKDELIPGKTLIFIDEIQELPDLMTMAKFLVQDGRFAYAFSGSMLGTELKRVRSYPVGFVTELTMYPMDFEEFCWANEVSGNALATVTECCRDRLPVPDYLHEHMLAYFRAYMVVGGMPAAVREFREGSGDLARVRIVQTELVNSYVHDITKYAGRAAPEVRAIFEQLPMQLDERSVRFKLNSLEPKARYEKFSRDFNWLVSAGVALKCNIVNDPKSPLKATERPSYFKLYESDTGMLVSRYPLAVARALYTDEREPNLGHLFENAFAQTLASFGSDIFYYMNRKRGEVDFMIEDSSGQVLPIEIKSGRSPRMHAALTTLLETKQFHGKEGYVFSRQNVGATDRVVYLPWYAASCLGDALDLQDPYAEQERSLIVDLPRI